MPDERDEGAAAQSLGAVAPTPASLDRRPVLAVAHDVTSASPLELVEVLRDWCDVVWVADVADPALGSWARLLPRLGRVVDVAGRDVDSLVDELRAAGVDGVVAFADSQLLRASLLAQGLDLAGNPPDVVVGLTDKVVQRELLRSGGLPGPGFVAVAGDARVEDVAEQVGALSFPVVIKPRNGTGSQDTVRVDDRPAALAHLTASLEAGSGSGLIVEELLADLEADSPGPFADYVSVEAVADRGTIVPLAVTGKFRLAVPFRETGNFLPHHLTADEADAVTAVAVRAAEVLGVRSGALHIEVKLTPDGPQIIEVNGRVAGGAIDAIFSTVHGRSLTAISAAIAVGLPVGIDTGATGRDDDRFDYAFFVQPPVEARALTHLGNLDALRSLEGVTATNVNKSVGDALDWRAGSQGYLLSVRGVAHGVDDLARVPERVLGVLDVDWG